MKKNQIPSSAHILIIDDEMLFAETVADKLSTLGHRADCAYTLADGIAQAESGDFEVILLDVFLPDGNGLTAIDRLRSVASQPQVIIITGDGNPDGAELAIRHGAWCYLEKTSILKEIVLSLTRALQYREALQEQPISPVVLRRDAIIGDSPLLNRCLDQLAKAAVSMANVLIFGESGTGKELFARAIHNNSPRRWENFVVVDCAALPENLVESVLFGHVQGSFTGADQARRGLICHADQGTLFLDEVGELSLEAQKSFLRVLQEHSFRPVGGHVEKKSDFRLLCATNRDLGAMVDTGGFREDLFHRLRGMILHLPPLRQRKDDLPLLVHHVLEQLARRCRQPVKEYRPELLEYLQAYDWPGNVRELFQTMESAVAEALHTPILFPQHLPLYVQTAFARSKVGEKSVTKEKISPELAAPLVSWREAKAEFERSYVLTLLQKAGGNKTKAAELSGLSRNRLYQLLAKYALE